MTMREFMDGLGGYYRHDTGVNGDPWPPAVRAHVEQWLSEYADRPALLDRLYWATLRTYSRQYRCLPDIKVLEDALARVPQFADQKPPPRPSLPAPPGHQERVTPEEVRSMAGELWRQKAERSSQVREPGEDDEEDVF